MRFLSPPTIGYRRYHEGDVLSIKTARGRNLTITPNHPILTTRGWIPAQDVDPLRDSIYGFGAGFFRYPKVDNMPPSAEEVFRTLKQRGRLTRIVGRPMDFHGDTVADGEIEIVAADSSLRSNVFNSAPPQASDYRYFGRPLPTSSQSVCLGTGLGSHSDCLHSPLLAPNFACVSCEVSPFFEAQRLPILCEHGGYSPSPLNQHRLSISSSRNVSLPQSRTNRFAANPELAPYLGAGLSPLVLADKIVDVKIERFSGHMYNFSTKEGWYVSNEIITHNCRPPSNRAPTKEETEACSFYTVRELALVKPKVIVALGASALKALTGETVIGRNRGKMLSLLPQYRADIPVLATYHPAAYLHNAGMREAYSKSIVEDMRLAQKIASGSVLQAKIYTSLSPGAAIKRTLQRLAKCDVLGCDLEWEVIPAKKKEPQGMWPWSTRRGRTPRAISIAIAGTYNGKMLSLSLPLDSPYAQEVRRIIRNTPTIYHNAMADLIWLHALGWKVKLEGDSYLLASLLNIESSLSLEALSTTLTDMGAWKEETRQTVGTMPQLRSEWRSLLRRNGNDAIATLLLHERLIEMMHEQGRSDAYPLYEHVLLPAVDILARTALNGVPIDRKLLKAHRRELRERMTLLTEKVGRTLRLPSNYEEIINSGTKLAPYLERIGLDLPRTKKTGKPSVTNDILLQNKRAHKIVPSIITVRKLRKRETSYDRPWDWLLEQQQDRRLHSIYRLAVASTGRSSAESELGYTFQQFPREAAMRRIVRAKKGWVILSVDLSQIELRLIAWLAHERRMTDFFVRDADLHTAMAGWIKALNAGWTLTRYLKNMDRWTSTVTKEERFGAKPIGFGLSYGGGPDVIKKTARQDYGITFTDEQAETGYDAYHLFYPDVKPWQDSFWRDVQRGYGTTPLGRRRSVPEGTEGPDGVWRKYINLPVQATASDLALFCQNYTWELLRGAHKNIDNYCENIGFFHDAGELHLDENLVGEVYDIVKHAWEHPPLERIGLDLTVPLRADIEVSRRWGEPDAYSLTR